MGVIFCELPKPGNEFDFPSAEKFLKKFIPEFMKVFWKVGFFVQALITSLVEIVIILLVGRYI